MNQVFAFLPSLRVFQFLGLSPFSIDRKYRPKEIRGFRFYSLFQIGFSLIALTGTLYEWNLYKNAEKSGIGNMVDFLQLIGMRLAYLTILCESFVQRHSLTKFFVSLSEVDAKMRNVKIDVGFEGKQGKNVLVLLLAITFYLGSQFVVLTMVILRHESQDFAYWFSYIFPYFVSCLRGYQAINFVWFIKQRFEVLNERLAQICLAEETTKVRPSPDIKLYIRETKPWKHQKVATNFEQLVMFREMYHKLYILSQTVNYAFGVSNLVIIANGFVAITLNSYFVFLRFKSFPMDMDDAYKCVESIFWSLPHLVNIVLLSAACHFTVQQVSRWQNLSQIVNFQLHSSQSKLPSPSTKSITT